MEKAVDSLAQMILSASTGHTFHPLPMSMYQVPQEKRRPTVSYATENVFGLNSDLSHDASTTKGILFWLVYA